MTSLAEVTERNEIYYQILYDDILRHCISFKLLYTTLSN